MITPVETPWRSFLRRRAEKRQRRRREYEARTGRRCYFTGTDHTDLPNIRTVWSHALATLEPVLGAAIIDLISDRQLDHLPEAAQHGLSLLKATDGGPIGIWVDLTDPAQFAAVQAFGIESIACNAYLASDTDRGRASAAAHEVAYNHDSGWSVFLELTDEEHAELSRRLELAGLVTDKVLFPSQP